MVSDAWQRGGAEAPGAAAAGATAGRTDRARVSCSICVRVRPGQAVQRQPEADRANRRGAGTVRRRGRTSCRSARRRASSADDAAQRQHAADRRAPAPGRTPAPAAHAPSGPQLRVLGQHVRRQPMLAPQVVVDVLIGRADQRRDRPAAARPGAAQNRAASAAVGIVGVVVRGEQCGVAPDRLAVRAPVRSRAPSAAAARPDSACPSRTAARRPAPSARAAGASAGRRGAAWSGRARRCSIPARRCRSAETKVGSPPMVSRTSPAPSARSTAAPHRQDRPATASSRVRLGDARRLAHARDRMSKPNSVSRLLRPGR